MSDTRLSQLLAAVPLPQGPVAVFHPPVDHDLSALPRDNAVVVQGFRPDHDGWAARGYQVAVTAPDAFDSSVIVVPRAKDQARALIAEAAQHGPVIVDGLKTHGVESLLKELRKRGDVSAPISKAHGKAFAVSLPAGAVDDWKAQPRCVDGWHTAPGLFSADGPDPGSVALAEALPTKLPGRVADLGAGWGYLARAVLDRAGVSEIALVEAEHTALDAARLNVTDPRATFHWADARHWTSPALDHVVMNPPFHSGRQADPGLGRAFISAAAKLLKSSGSLWMVANRHLPYETTLTQAFRDVTELPGSGAFKLYRATGPIDARKRR